MWFCVFLGYTECHGGTEAHREKNTFLRLSFLNLRGSLFNFLKFAAPIAEKKLK